MPWLDPDSIDWISVKVGAASVLATGLISRYFWVKRRARQDGEEAAVSAVNKAISSGHLVELKRLQGLVGTLSARVEEVERRLSSELAARVTAEAEVAAVRAQNVRLESEVVALRQQNNEQGTEIARLRGELARVLSGDVGRGR